MSELRRPRSDRVRITGPRGERPRAQPRTGAADQIDAQSELGEIYVSALLRSQLRQAVRTLVTLAVTVGSLPLLFHWFPVLTDRQLLGMPVSWVMLAFGCYPVLVLLAWRYVRASERNEDEFAHMVGRR